MTVLQLCTAIGLQAEMTVRVATFSEGFDFNSLYPMIDDLCYPDRAQSAYEGLVAALGDDPDGTKILSCYLLAATKTHGRYREKGIPEEIFFDTVKCFPRFIGESLERKGVWVFDRAHWAYRHLNMTIFRLGTLEFARVVRKGVRVNAIHIPSGADLSPAAVDASLKAARAFLKKYYPDYADAPFTCDSWLMGEGLREVLGDGSNIIKFQDRFAMEEQYPDSEACLIPIFHRVDCKDYKNLPEDTSLQRRVKARLLSGKGIGGGYGVLRED